MRKETKVTVQRGGRVAIPAALRKRLGLRVGDELLARVTQEGDLVMTTPALAVKHAQESVRRYIPADRRLSKELLEERRRQMARE